MTLTRNPCELDTMSLFQDLKLKRRKVDSRCSSDGESVAETSTSSPDMAGPPSPCPKLTSPSPEPETPRNRVRLSPEQPRIRSSPEQRIRLSPEHPRVTSEQLKLRLSLEQSRIRLSPDQQPRVRLSPDQQPRLRLSPDQQPRVRLSPEQQQRLSPLIQKGSPVIQRSMSGGEQNTSGGVLNMISPGAFWVNSAASGRINGVRPELIGGNVNMNFPVNSQNSDMKPPRPVSTPGTPTMTRQTPTVIMGEAGGVRTMIWSQPNPSSPADHQNQNMAASTSAINWSTSPQSSAVIVVKNQRRNFYLISVNPNPLNMERLWAGDLTQLPVSQQNQALNLALPPGDWPRDGRPQGITIIGEPKHDPEDDEQPMICMICEDRATGLHYGIITCEGCKGFFKRTVQNRRVYTCVADGNCEITKAQRNRCQYCRFKKCIEQGMVLQAVREDRMPGGRNSGAVYNLYKVLMRERDNKFLNVIFNNNEKGNQQKSSISSEQTLPSHIVNGTILKTALTNPSEVVHLRQRLDNTVSSSRDRTFPLDTILNMIQALVDCDEFQDIATLRNLEDLLDHKSDLSEKLCQIGDSIVYKLVQWTKRLPFYLELPVEVHTRLLTHKWHELLVLTTSAYQAIHGVHKLSSTSTAGQEADFTQEVSNNLVTLQTCLTSMMGRPITMDQLRQDVGLMVEKITHVTLMFRRVKLRMEEYVCLKVITMLNQGRGGSNELEAIQDRYMMCLKSFVEHSFPQQPARFHELLLRLPEIQSAASLLLESKMFYVPFLLNSAIQR
ncbi:orphan nuclear receptor nr6a1, putative [Pediculus humanus corporis]|uniref:Orphan nuclear receptor nr6a1, putative n=1 Tax=Pediculus humanus subsp. corporis TaxID=121224 RepID=E0VGZ2_PEDHC|nr:orphan nuclear receptor nr6a1, putative [Pediculus humanus corporis]EEB12648.1 orphan nuclear receptor nr6a1, putative [Pediculus humanus corporis]